MGILGKILTRSLLKVEKNQSTHSVLHIPFCSTHTVCISCFTLVFCIYLQVLQMQLSHPMSFMPTPHHITAFIKVTVVVAQQ
jgi:hypothetical protein